MSLRELESLAKRTNPKANEEVIQLNERGRPKREAKAVDSFGNFLKPEVEKASTSRARGVVQKTNIQHRQPSKKSKPLQKPSVDKQSAKNYVTMEANFTWPTDTPARIFGHWGYDNQSLKFEYRCEGGYNDTSPPEGLYTGWYMLENNEKVVDSFVLSVNPLGDDDHVPVKCDDRDFNGGWILQGEGNNDSYGKFKFAGHVSIGGDTLIERKGGVPKRSSMPSKSAAATAAELAAALAASQSESRLERKRKREEAAALQRLQRENEECGVESSEVSQLQQVEGDDNKQAEDSTENMEEEVIDPFLQLKRDFSWVYEARDYCNEVETAESSGWIMHSHQWIGKRVRVGVGMPIDSSLPASGSNFTDFVDGFIIGWKPKTVETVNHRSKRKKSSKNDSEPIFGHNTIMWKAALPNEEVGDSVASQELPFTFHYFNESEGYEAMKMGGKRRAAVVKTNNRMTAAKEALAIATAKAEEKKDLELICRHILKAVKELEAEREREEQADMSLTIVMLRRFLSSAMKRDRGVLQTMLYRGLDTMVERGKIKLIAFPPSMIKQSSSKKKAAGASGTADEESDEVVVSAAELDEEDRVYLRYRSVEAIEQEKLRKEQEERLYSRYRKVHHVWPTWKYGELCPDEDSQKKSQKKGGDKDFDEDELAPPIPARTPLHFYGLLYRHKYAQTYDASQSSSNGKKKKSTSDFSSDLGFELLNQPRLGWHREAKMKKNTASASKAYVYYYAPDGAQVRSRNELRRYIHNKLSLKRALEAYKSQSKLTAEANISDQPIPSPQEIVSTTAASTGISDQPTPSPQEVVVEVGVESEAMKDSDDVYLSEEDKILLEIESNMTDLDIENDFDFSRNMETVQEIKSRDKSYVYYDNQAMNAEISEIFKILKQESEVSLDDVKIEQDTSSKKSGLLPSCKILRSTAWSEQKSEEDLQRFNFENDIYLAKLAEMEGNEANVTAAEENSGDENEENAAAESKGSLFDTNVELGSRRRSRVVYFESAPKLSDFVSTAVENISQGNNGNGATLLGLIEEVSRIAPPTAGMVTASSVRSVLNSCFKSGKLRRRLVSLSADWPIASGAPGGHWLRTEAALRGMLMSILQVSQNHLGDYDLPLNESEHQAKLSALNASKLSGSGIGTSSNSDATSSKSYSVERDFVKDGTYAIVAPPDVRTKCRGKIWWSEDKLYYSGECLQTEYAGGNNSLCLFKYDDGSMTEWIQAKEGGRWAQEENKPVNWDMFGSSNSVSNTLSMPRKYYGSDAGDDVLWLPPPPQWVQEAFKILTVIKSHRYAVPFLYPVDVRVIPDYLEVIKKPMDLQTVSDKLVAGKYKVKQGSQMATSSVTEIQNQFADSAAEQINLSDSSSTVNNSTPAPPVQIRNESEGIFNFAADIRLIFNNCWLFNNEGSDINKWCRELAFKFEKELEKSVALLGLTPAKHTKKSKGSKDRIPSSSASSAASSSSSSPPASSATIVDPTATAASNESSIEVERTVEIESPFTVNDIMKKLPLNVDTRKFATPIGWQFDPRLGLASTSSDAVYPNFGKNRGWLEEYLEEQNANFEINTATTTVESAPPLSNCDAAIMSVVASHNMEVDNEENGEKVNTESAASSSDTLANYKGGGPWLGQVINGVWEIREVYLLPALKYVLNGLKKSGHIEEIDIEGSGGRIKTAYVVANRYITGEPPERPEKPKVKREGRPPRAKVNAWDVNEEELSEFEKQRLVNMQRNQAFLSELGLG